MGPEKAAQKLEDIARRMRDPRQPVLFIVAVFGGAAIVVGVAALTAAVLRAL